MWTSLCTFLYRKLFPRPTEVTPSTEELSPSYDSTVDPVYGKRLKLSDPHDIDGWVNQAKTPEKLTMQSQEKLTTNNGDEEDCRVIGEVYRKNSAGPSSSASKKYAKDFHQKIATVNYIYPPYCIDRPTCPNKDNNPKRDVVVTLPYKEFKFFGNPRSDSIKKKQIKSKLDYKNYLKRKSNSLQQAYRLKEKKEYEELLQSHTSRNLAPFQSSSPHQIKRPEAQVISVVDLTSEKTSKEDEDVQFIQELPGVRTSLEMRLVKPYKKANNKILRMDPKYNPEALKMDPKYNPQTLKKDPKYSLQTPKMDPKYSVQTPKMDPKYSVQTPKKDPKYSVQTLKKDPKYSPHAINLTNTENNPITISDDEDNKEKKTYPKSLEERLTAFMHITKLSTTEVKSSLEVRYKPKLTLEQEKKIEKALKGGSPRDVLAKGFDLMITRHDMSTLSNLGWLNDDIINFYMHLIMERSKGNSTLPKVYAFNTFFYAKLVTTGHPGLKRWTKKVDIFSFDIILVPIHLGVHWCLAVIDFRSKTLKYYDSMGGDDHFCLDNLFTYLEAEKLDKKSEHLSVKSWAKCNVRNIPQQMNGSDCGVFTCVFAEYVARDGPMLFDQGNMPYFRRKMVIEILEGKLLN